MSKAELSRSKEAIGQSRGTIGRSVEEDQSAIN